MDTSKTRFYGFFIERSWLGFLAAFVVMVPLFFFDCFSNDFLFRDVFHEFYPLRLLWSWAAAGELPFWNPHICMGTPVSGAIYPGLFYPLNWVLSYILKLSAGASIKAYVIVHFIVAGFGMGLFVRSFGLRKAGALTGGIAYAFSGYLVGQHYAINLLGGFALLPLSAAAMSYSRKQNRLSLCPAAGVLSGLVLVGGDPQGFALSLVFGVLVYLLLHGERRNAGFIQLMGGPALFLVFAVAASAIELLPAFTVLEQSYRSAGFGMDTAGCWSFHPLRLVEFLLVRPFGDVCPERTYWGAFLGERCFPYPLSLSPYMGVWTVIAAGAAIRYRGKSRSAMFFIAVVIGSLLMATGRFSPLFTFLFNHVPGMSILRFPEKYLLMTSLGMAALVGMGTDCLVYRRKEASWKRKLGIGGVLLFIALLLFVFRAFFVELLAPALAPLLEEGLLWEVSSRQASSELYHSILRLLLAGGLAFIVLASLASPISLRQGMWLLPALFLFLDLWQANSALAPATPGLYKTDITMGRKIIEHESIAGNIRHGKWTSRLADAWSPEPRYLDKYALGSFRIARDPAIPAPHSFQLPRVRKWETRTCKPNLGMVLGLEYFKGMNVTATERQNRMFSEILHFADLPLYNVKYAIVPVNMLRDLPRVFTLRVRSQGTALVEFNRFHPRAYWIEGSKAYSDWQELARLFPRTDFRKEVLIETEDGSNPFQSSGGREHGLKKARIISYSPNRVVVKVRAPAPGWLVLNDMSYPGWTARVNSKQARIWQANGLVRATRVDKGVSRVVFAFRPPLLKTGTAFSLAAILAAIAVLFISRTLERRKERKGKASAPCDR